MDLLVLLCCLAATLRESYLVDEVGARLRIILQMDYHQLINLIVVKLEHEHHHLVADYLVDHNYSMPDLRLHFLTSTMQSEHLLLEIHPNYFPLKVLSLSQYLRYSA